MNTLRRLIWPTLYLLSTIGLAQAKDGDNVIAIIIDDSSSMSKEPGRDGNDPEGNAARAAAFRVISEKAGTTLGYFTFGSATIQGAKPLIPAFEVPESMTERQKRLKTVIKGLKEENVRLAKKLRPDEWKPHTPHPYWGDQTPCVPALRAANEWLKTQSGKTQVFLLTDGECKHGVRPTFGETLEGSSEFSKEVVRSILGTTPIHCAGLGDHFKSPNALLRKACDTFTHLEDGKIQLLLKEVNRSVRCDAGGQPHQVGSPLVHTKQAFSTTCFGVSDSRTEGPNTIRWTWPRAKAFKGTAAIQVGGDQINELMVSKMFRGEENADQKCEALIKSGEGVIRPTFILRAKLEWMPGRCPSDPNNFKPSFSHSTDERWACLRGKINAVLNSDGGREVHATNLTLMSYTGQKLADMTKEFSLSGWTIQGEGRPFWTKEVKLKKSPTSFRFEPKPEKKSTLKCSGPFAAAAQLELSHREQSNCKLKPIYGKQCDFSDDHIVDFGVVSDKVDKACNFTLECQGNDARPVTYEVQAASNDKALAQDCFTFEVNQKQLTFEKERTRQVRFTLGPPNDRDACDRELTSRGRATYDVPMRLAAGKDEVNFTLKATRKAGLSINVQGELRDEQSPLSWQGSGRHAQPLKVSFGYTGLRDGVTVKIDVNDIKVRVVDSQDASSLINLENRLAKRFDHRGAWWRHEVDQPKTSYRWVRCKKDPKTEEYIPARDVVIGGDRDPEVCIQFTDRLDRCAGGGFFNLCDQTNEPVTFELSAFRKVVDGTEGAIQNPKSGHTTTAQIVIHRGWLDWFFAGPGLWWIWLFNPLFGFLMVILGLRSTAKHSFEGLFKSYRFRTIFWILWIIGSAAAVYFHLAD